MDAKSRYDAFVSAFDMDPKEHTSYMLIQYYLWCILTSNIVSISCDISHAIGIEIC